MKAMGVVAIDNEAFISDVALKQLNAAIHIFWSAGMTVLTPKTNRRNTPRQADGTITISKRWQMSWTVPSITDWTDFKF